MKEMGEAAASAVLSVEQARKIFKKQNKSIRRIIEQKIVVYKPLEIKEAYDGFIEWIQRDDFGPLRTLPETASEDEIEAHIETSIRHYLIEQAYYKLEERFVKSRLKKKLWDFEPNTIKFMEMVDFVTEHIERNNFARIKSFGERCSFTTFLATAVSSILNDFWRSVRSAQENVKRYVGTTFTTEEDEEENNEGPIKQEISFGDLLQKGLQEPYEAAARDEQAEFLPEALGKLDKEQLLALKLKYEKGMNLSLIARTLGQSRYKVEQLIEKTEFFIKKEIMLKLEEKRRQQ